MWNQGIQIYLDPLVTSDPEGRGRAGQGWRLRLHKRAKRSAEDGGALEETGAELPFSLTHLTGHKIDIGLFSEPEDRLWFSKTKVGLGLIDKA